MDNTQQKKIDKIKQQNSGKSIIAHSLLHNQ